MNESRRHRINEVNILGVRFDNLSRQEVLDRMEDYIRQGWSHMICTPNVDHILQARRDKEFRQILESADLVVSDGMGVVYSSRFLGAPFRENVGGRLLLSEFAARAAQRGYRLFLLGGRGEETVQKVVARLCADNHGLVIAGTYIPPFMPEFDEAETGRMLDAIHRARPDVLFVCLGTPKQEKWIARNLDRIEAAVSLGVGAALDILAGEIRQPPSWITEIGLEWLFRLAQEPKRLSRRYLWDDPRFLWLVLKQRFASRE